MNYKFGVYGDSIAFGYGNNNQSWFDIVSLGSKAIKLAQNGETVCNVLEKIKLDNNCYEVLYVAVGVNDLLVLGLESGKIDFSFLIIFAHFSPAFLSVNYQNILSVFLSHVQNHVQPDNKV